MFEMNLRSIEQIFNNYKARGGKWLSLRNVELMLRDARTTISEKEMAKCYSFSKISVIDEINSGGAYQKMIFVEFLEFLGRIANSLIKNGEPVYIKLEKFLE